MIDRHGFKGLFLGIRRDEEGTRAKERIFSPRDKNFEWNYKDQPPELWDQFNTDFGQDTHIRIHPLLHGRSWTSGNTSAGGDSRLPPVLREGREAVPVAGLRAVHRPDRRPAPPRWTRSSRS